MKLKSVKFNNPCQSVILTITSKAHGGELSANSKVGKGSEFIILLPIPTK